MKKIFAILLLSLVLASCFNKNEDTKKTGSGTGIVVSENTKVSYEGIEIDTSEENLDKQRNEITLDDIDLIGTSEKPKNELLSIGTKFKENLDKSKDYILTKNIDGGASIENLEKEIKKVPETLRRNIDLEVNIYDFETKKLIEKSQIFVNTVKLGESENGNFRKEFSWVKGIENFTVMARTTGYGDGFIRLNSLNSDGSYLRGDIYLKKLNSDKKLTLDKEVKIEDKDLIIKIPECALVDSNGNCYKGEVESKINFISGDDVNSGRVSLNMKALTKEGKIVNLRSGGMAFTDFIATNGEILQVGEGKTIEITYKVDKQTILNMENTLYGRGEKNGYWLYDKNRNIWLEKEAEIKLDKENNTWTAIVSEIY